MNSPPVAQPYLLTVSEYLEIGEIEPGFSELVEGRLLMSPGPVPRHNRAVYRLARQLEQQLPDTLEAILDMDIDLRLVPSDAPGWVRRPDLVVASREAWMRVDRNGGILRADDVTLAVEVISPGSRRTDLVNKRGEYADAGIPHYWIVDLTEPVSMLVCHLAGEFGYADGGAMTGRFTDTAPFDVTVDLDALL